MQDIVSIIKRKWPLILLCAFAGILMAGLALLIAQGINEASAEEKQIIIANAIEQASDEELIEAVEKRFENPTMDTICEKLASYAKGLDDGIRYGIITLPEGEMRLIRQYIKDNLEMSEERWEYYKIEGTDEIFSGIGACAYKDYKFLLEKDRQVIFIGPEYRKPVAIANSVDHPDDNKTAFERILAGYTDGFAEYCQYDLINTKEYCYTYQRDDKNVTVRKWQFDVLCDEWSCKAWKKDLTYYGAPDVLYWLEDEDEYSLVAESHLLLVRNGKITVLAEGLDYDTKARMFSDTPEQFFYIKHKELHTVNINTLEDIIVTEQYPEIFEMLS